MKKIAFSVILFALCTLAVFAIDLTGGLTYVDYSTELGTGIYPCAIGAEAAYNKFSPFKNHPTKIYFSFETGMDSRSVNADPSTGEPFTVDNVWEDRDYDVLFSHWNAQIDQEIGKHNNLTLTVGLEGRYEAAFNPLVTLKEEKGHALDNPVFENPNVGIPELSGKKQINNIDFKINLDANFFKIETLFNKNYLRAILSVGYKKDLGYDIHAFISASGRYLIGKDIPYYVASEGGCIENSRFALNASTGLKYKGPTFLKCFIPEASLSINYGFDAGELNNMAFRKTIFAQSADIKFSASISAFDILSLSCGFKEVFIYTGTNPDVETGFTFKKPSVDLVINFTD